MQNLAVIILAAGRSKRMFTKVPKVLHKVGGKPLIERVMKAVNVLEPSSIVTVVGYEKDQVIKYLGETSLYAEQRELLGTGHAVMQALPALKNESEVMVICGDMPLITGDILAKFVKSHNESDASLSLMSAIVPWESDFGRIIRHSGEVTAIREYKDASPEERKIKEVNLALYIIKRELLDIYLPMLKTENAQKEYYLTDIIALMVRNNLKINAYICEDPQTSRGVNSRGDLAELNDIVKERKNRELMQSGVTIIDPKSTFIEEDVQIGIDTVIYPFTFIEGRTIIGENCSIGPSSKLTSAKLGSNVSVTHSIVLSSEIGDNTSIGPFAYIRADNRIGENVKIGDFTELKNSTIGNGSKIPHLSYVGDAAIGEKVNIGAGTITCNYDGRNKHRTVIGDGTHIGSNTNLVAPVNVGKYVITGAGSVVTRDIPDNVTVYGVPAKIK